MSVETTTVNAVANGPERAGVFRLNVTPTKAGIGRIVIDVEAGSAPQHFTIDQVPVYPDVAAALANEAPEEGGLIGYAKERSWEEDYATAPVLVYFPAISAFVPASITASASPCSSDT